VSGSGSRVPPSEKKVAHNRPDSNQRSCGVKEYQSNHSWDISGISLTACHHATPTNQCKREIWKWLLVVGCFRRFQVSVFRFQDSTFPSISPYQPSTINHQPSTINHQPSTINHQLPPCPPSSVLSPNSRGSCGLRLKNPVLRPPSSLPQGVALRWYAPPRWGDLPLPTSSPGRCPSLVCATPLG